MLGLEATHNYSHFNAGYRKFLTLAIRYVEGHHTLLKTGPDYGIQALSVGTP